MLLRCSALVLLCCAAVLHAAAPSVYLVHHARIVRVSGPTLDSGDILIRDGLIEAVGQNLTAPPDAWVIEGAGFTVYPGLIDALSTWGLPGASPPPTTPGRVPRAATPVAVTPGTPPPAPANGPEDRPLNAAFYRAADHLNPSDPVIANVRDGGFTSAVVFPTENIFAGQGAVINLAGENAGGMIVASPAGQYLSMKQNSYPGFPSAIMGTIAYIRQVYLDAEHYQAAKAIYNAHPAGLPRPGYDHWIEGLIESPRALLPARRAVEIDRMLRLAAELKINAVLYGGDEAWKSAGLLKQAGVPVLVSLKWPERPKDADPALPDPLRILESRDKAPSTPAALAQAQVKFAFYSDGLNNPKDIHKAVRKALDAGLSKDFALRALTLSPAEIFGVSDRLGSLDAGKIANLVVTDGDWFEDKTKVRFIFVDGVRFEPQPEAPKPANPPVDAQATPAFGENGSEVKR